jgi:hypothetical protein
MLQQMACWGQMMPCKLCWLLLLWVQRQQQQGLPAVQAQLAHQQQQQQAATVRTLPLQLPQMMTVMMIMTSMILGMMTQTMHSLLLLLLQSRNLQYQQVML